MNITRKSASFCKEKYDQFGDYAEIAFLLSKMIARNVHFKPTKGKTANDISFSRDEAINMVKNFYNLLNPEMSKIVDSILDESNPDFSITFYNKNMSSSLPQTPCVTDELEGIDNLPKKNIICMPVEDKTKISLHEVFQLVHELSHSVAITHENNRNDSNSLDMEVTEKRGYIFGETESKVMEFLFAKYLSSNFPQYRDSIDGYVQKSLLDSILRDAEQTYFQLGVGKTSINYDGSAEFLSDEEIDLISDEMGISDKEIFCHRISKFMNDDNINRNDTFKYMFGGLIAVHLINNSHNMQESAQKLFSFFKNVKDGNIDTVLKDLGLDSFNIHTIKILQNELEKMCNERNNDVER